MMVAGEASGDLYGGALAEALFAQEPRLSIIGFGGAAMRQAGVDVRFDITALAVVGLLEVIAHGRAIFAAYRLAITLLREGVTILVLIDYPDFNLRLARIAKARGIRVVYYVSPQVWAWRSGRIKTIAQRVDQMLVILPFEERLYNAANVPCAFVGHPLLDDLRPPSFASKKDYLAGLGLDPKGTTLAFLPGSRVREVLMLLPEMLAAAAQLREKIPRVQILVAVAPSLPIQWMHDRVAASPIPVRCVEDIYNVLGASDMAVVASGTATLQTALAGVPMIVVYKIAGLSYLIARRLVKTSSISLVNIIAGTSFVPELIQGAVSAERISDAMARLLTQPEVCERMKEGYQAIAAALGDPGVARRAAAIVLAEHR